MIFAVLFLTCCYFLNVMLKFNEMWSEWDHTLCDFTYKQNTYKPVAFADTYAWNIKLLTFCLGLTLLHTYTFVTAYMWVTTVREVLNELWSFTAELNYYLINQCDFHLLEIFDLINMTHYDTYEKNTWDNIVQIIIGMYSCFFAVG